MWSKVKSEVLGQKQATRIAASRLEYVKRKIEEEKRKIEETIRVARMCEKAALQFLPKAKYDVFLSFRGENTRASFTSHLHSSLSNTGIVVFKDDVDLPRGNDISKELLIGIQSSSISIIIFSNDYAGSKWCLNELSEIMGLRRAQGQVVLPVFYGVDPSEVRNQVSSFGEAFHNLIQRISPTEDQVSKWTKDLIEAGGIAGFVVLNSKNESEDIENIVKHACKILDKTDLFIANHPIGLDSRLQDLVKISENHSMNDVLLLGICGMGGTGKTTIAKAIYNEMGPKFESRSFLSNIREVWGRDNGPVYLQQQLHDEICKTKMMVIRSIDSRKKILKDSLHFKRALVVFDDVNGDGQLNALCGSREWFGPGSRIIITTRDKHMLKLLKVDHVYNVKNMDESESVELFSWHAFKQPAPKKGFIDLSRNMVAYCGGLPLALEVLGSYLFDREEKEWRSVLDKLKRIPNDEIQKKLKISFDDLDDVVKEIFLDISCFFVGMDRSDVTHILDGSGLFPDIGISVLVERSLVTIDEKNKLGMHDLLRDMGREIVRERSPRELGKRSRLWIHDEVVDVLSKHTGTESVEGLALSSSQTCFSSKAFKKMKTLRLLHLGDVELDGDYKYFSRDLRWLCWRGFPLKYILKNFYQKSLVAIELKYSSLRQVWKEPQIEKLEEDIEQMDSLSTLIADNTAITQVPISLVRSKSIGYISVCGYQGLAHHLLPSLIWSRMSPTNNPLSLIPTYSIMPSSISTYIPNCSIPVPSLIDINLPKPQTLLLESASKNGIEVNQGVAKILDTLQEASSKDMETTPNNSKILEIESSVLADNHSQVGTSKPNKCLRHLLIPIGRNDQVTSSLSECILQGLTLRDHGDDCVFPGDKYPYWQCFKGEGASVKFEVPLVRSYGLKGISVCCEYHPLGDLGNVEHDSFISMLIINYTNETTVHYRKDTIMTSFEEAKWKEIISNLDSDDHVEITALFGNGFTVKRTVVYLKYCESFDEQMEDQPSSSREMYKDDDKVLDFKFFEPKLQKIE